MRKNLYLSLLVAIGYFSSGCQPEQPNPNFSGLENITYTLETLATSSTADNVEVAVYPNPFVDRVSVNVFSPSGETSIIYFSDEKGKYSKKIELPEGKQTVANVDFTGMPKGIYLCEVQAQGKVSKFRLIKGR